MYIIHKNFRKPIAPAKDESPKQVAAPTKPVSTPVVKPPLIRQISAKNAPVEKPAIPATHAKFTPPKSPFSRKVVTNKSLEQATPTPEPNKSLSQSSKVQNDVQKDLSKKETQKELPTELPKELPKETPKELSKDFSNKKSVTQTKPVAITDDKVPVKAPFLKQSSVKPIQSPNQIQKHETATKPEPEITKTTEPSKLTTEPTEQKFETNRPINKKFGLNSGKSTETKSAPEKTAPEKVIPSKATLKPIPEKTAQSKPASELKTTIVKPELKPIPPKPEPVPEPKQLPAKSALKPIPPKAETTKSAPPPPPPPPSGMGEIFIEEN